MPGLSEFYGIAISMVGDRVLQIRFDDGLVRQLDFDGCLTGVLALIDSDDAFARVQIDPVAGTVCWPQGIDLDPDVLHGDEAAAARPGPRVVREHWLEPTA